MCGREILSSGILVRPSSYSVNTDMFKFVTVLGYCTAKLEPNTYVSPSSPPPQDADLGTVLVRSVVDGATLIVTEVECQDLVTNTLLMDTLLIRKVISRASTPLKVMVSCAHVVQDFW